MASAEFALAPSSENPTDWRPRRIAIIGAGATGTSLAAIIGRSAPVVMVCRNPDRAAELFRSGARTKGLTEASSRPIIVPSVEDLARVGGVSVVFVATKTTAIPSVAADIKPHLSAIADQPGGVFVVSFQNGIRPGAQLIEALGHDRVLRMVLNFGATLRPGYPVVDITLDGAPHFIGAADPDYHDAAERLAAMLTDAGFATTAERNIEPRVWSKAIVNAAMNPVAALVDSTVGEVLRSPSCVIVDKLLHEGLAVARADGLEMPSDYINRAYDILSSASNHTPSMVEDIRTGRESEVGQLNRQIIEDGRRHAVATPTHEVIDALIETFDWKVYLRTRSGA